DDSLVRNQFGGSFGGPIIKDKTFFYGTGELHRVRQTYPIGPTTSTTNQFLNFVQSGGLQQWAEGTGAYAPGTNFPGICIAALGVPCPGAFPNSSTFGPIFSTLYSNPAMHYPTVSGSTCPAVAPDPNNDPCAARGIWSGGLGLRYPVPVYGTIT